MTTEDAARPRRRGSQAGDGESKRAARDRDRRQRDPKVSLSRGEKGKALEMAAKLKMHKSAKRKAARAGKPEPTEVEAETQIMSFAAWANGRTLREERVDEVVRRMAQGAWLPGVSCRLLAETWEVSPSVVETVAAEASRVMRRLLRDDDGNFLADARVEVLQTFRAIRTRAIAMSSAQAFPPSAQVAALNVAMQATRLYGFYLGLEPSKSDRRLPERENFDDWTPEELDDYARSGKMPERKAPVGVH